MWDELRRPATAIAVMLLAISIAAGLLSSFYFYKKGEKAGRISIRVDQIQVFDKNRMGQLPLKVINSSGQIINENVFAANLAIWNSGNAEIAKTAVREPFQIVLEDNATPIDLTVTSYSSPFQGFSITPDGKMSWEHFDPGQGIKLRIVYVHAAEERVNLIGSAVGLQDIQDLQNIRKNHENKTHFLNWFTSVLITLYVIYIIAIAVMRYLTGIPLSRGIIIPNVINFVMIFILIAQVVYFNLMPPELPTPPF